MCEEALIIGKSWVLFSFINMGIDIPILIKMKGKVSEVGDTTRRFGGKFFEIPVGSETED